MEVETRSSRNTLITQKYYQQVALESADYYMLEIATTGIPCRKRRERFAAQKSSPTMSSLHDKVELMQQRIDKMKKQHANSISL